MISPTDSWIYEYDALGNVVATVHNGQTTENLVDPTGLNDLVGQYTSSGGLIADYTYGLGLAEPGDCKRVELLSLRRAWLNRWHDQLSLRLDCVVQLPALRGHAFEHRQRWPIRSRLPESWA